MKKSLIVLLLAIASAGLQAQTTAPAAPAAAASEPAKSDWTVAGNAGLFSDYRFRGISQTDKRPALQGGIDISHASGFYVGNSSFYAPVLCQGHRTLIAPFRLFLQAF